MTKQDFTNEQIVLSIANNKLSVSRIRRIAKASHGVDLTSAQVTEVTSEAGIATPQGMRYDEYKDELKATYPDSWSFLLEARSFWVRVRRYWGDTATLELEQRVKVATAGQWRALRKQFDAYIDPEIYERNNINLFKPDIETPLETERLYSWEVQRDMYLRACRQEFKERPDSQVGVKFPLPSPEFKAFKRVQFEEDCLKVFEREFENEKGLMDYFTRFWQAVYKNRGENYFESLKADLVGFIDQPLGQKSFYSLSEHYFRHFLHNLDGFKNTEPWRIPIYSDPARRLPMKLEGALAKYGWHCVRNIAAIAILAADVSDEPDSI